VAFYEVMWKGYTETTNEPRDGFLKDVPKMINQFEKRINQFEKNNKIHFF
jgi:hypothetical protein